MTRDVLRALGRHLASRHRNASPGVRQALAELLRDLAADTCAESAAYLDGCADALTFDDARRARPATPTWIH